MTPAGRRPARTLRALGASFYAHDTVSIARNLLGTVLVHDTPEGRTAGRIVETEAYLKDDAACHASRGITPRTEVMFGPPGRAYIYLIYGMYNCFNVITAPRGTGEAVLIRALEPLEGLELMAMRRGRDADDVKSLCSGPGKLVLAMGIIKAQNGVDLKSGTLRILPAASYPWEEPGPGNAASSRNIKVTKRIGISVAADLPLRFHLDGNPFISRK